MGSLSPTHWLIIALLVLVLFGAKRLPDAARGVGRSLRIFKSEMSEMQSDSSQKTEQPAKAPTQELPPAQPSAPAPQSNPETHKA
ncbi:sec-independent protein translocase protein TatA [Nocardia transvalensis]|uniref:Sec-independent protein translocase protein TatA n=1 Tax=Nocardia transvalensis TaxID=37333 RepID=A0A7W9PJF0_9NOCA|nr:Sec-independent protein translocase subunit TatA [Nocardia transvalensis]MBB5917050.1 sec-independent protein translocase protein TatA [Nocardia transvalensis]